MSNFQPFARAVAAQFALMSQHELFTVGIDAETLLNGYQAAFPEGTNRKYRERAEHDCTCCNNFIKNIGNVVAIIDGKIVTVWDIVGEVEVLYATVAGRMVDLVRQFPVTGIFRAGMPKYGAENSKEMMADGSVHTWNHFYGDVAARHFAGADSAAQIGKHNNMAGVFKRGLEELKAEAFEQVSELIADKLLYRGEEKLGVLMAFFKMHQKYRDLGSDTERNLFIMLNAQTPASQFRGDVMGTLITDLSDGMPTEKAVKAYEKKVAPENYQRPTALVTQKQKDQALATIAELGLEPALARRFANIHDVTINNVLWADNDVKPMMKGGLAGLLDTIPNKDKTILTGTPEDISIADFLANVLPRAKTIDMMVKSRYTNNFMAITAPVYEAEPDAESLFKWANGFAHVYTGNMADSALRQKVANLGGRVDGVLRFSHTWNDIGRNASLMDLHVFMPGVSAHRDGQHNTYPIGQRVGWNCRNDRISGGNQDVDYTTAAPEGYVPVENITFPTMDRLKDGDYTFKIHNWSFRQPTTSGFKAEIELGGQIFSYDHPAPLKHHEWITLAVATLKNGEWSIKHEHAVGTASVRMWGVDTEQFVRVNTVMLSPNHWDDNATGNKHFMFILDGCKADEALRGIMNEYLNPKLEQHRKVFELLGDKTKCQPTDEQLAGLGFSSTKGDSVVVSVAGDKLRKAYNIIF